MEVLYGSLIALFALLMLAGVVEAVTSVSSKQDWPSARFATVLNEVVTLDRRTQPLPFVGVDRRQAASGQEGVRRAA